MSSTSLKNISLRASWIGNSNLCAIHQTKAIHGISSFIIAWTPLFFSELTVAPSAPTATIWFLNSGKPRMRAKTNLFSIRNYFESHFYCWSKLSNQPHLRACTRFFKLQSTLLWQIIKSKYKPWGWGCYPILSLSPVLLLFFYKKTILNRKKPKKNSCVD